MKAEIQLHYFWLLLLDSFDFEHQQTFWIDNISESRSASILRWQYEAIGNVGLHSCYLSEQAPPQLCI